MAHRKLKLMENTIIFFTGFFLYGLIEIAFRGYTHYSMALAGGVVLIILYYLNLKLNTRSLILRGLLGSAVITAVEFVTGLLVNIKFSLGVWDYSHQPFNILGQICPAFSFCWAGLSVVAFYLSVYIFWKLNKKFPLRQE